MKDRIKDDWRDSKKAVLSGWQLNFDFYSWHWGGGVANIEEEKSQDVKGVIYDLTEEQFNRLKSYEGGYHEIQIMVDSNGERIDAVAFVVTNKRGFNKPSERYINTIITGLREHGYDEEIINEVKRIAGL